MIGFMASNVSCFDSIQNHIFVCAWAFGEDIERIPKYDEWYYSTYKIDKRDHSERFICVLDIFSQLWRLVESVGRISYECIAGFCGIILTACLIPFSFCCKCCKFEKVLTYSLENLMAFPANFIVFMCIILPKLIIKIIGNAIGVIIPEVGRGTRTCSLLKIGNLPVDPDPSSPSPTKATSPK